MMPRLTKNVLEIPGAVSTPSTFWGTIDAEERKLLGEALSTLLAERSRAFRIAHDMALARDREPPTVDDFKLSHILRLQRAMTEVNKA
jgi:hypothetical protein